MRRRFMAEVVSLMGRGGQRFAEEFLGWNRKTIRKGIQERASGQPSEDRFSDRGRPRAEERLPELLVHLREIVEPRTQTDPTFRSTQIYTPITAGEVRRRLHEQFEYGEEMLPCVRTVRSKLNALGYQLKRVRKCRPLKKIPETNAIFEEVRRVNSEADSALGVVRVSLDTKATVKVGDYSRGGENRCYINALDHDFGPAASLTPFGIFIPKSAESHLWFSESKVTADFMVDRLAELWPSLRQTHQAHTLVLNADNGPESNGQRTQWLKRLVEFADEHQVTVKLAYYPPYHSKYNPVERLWGVLENHWRGELLSTVDKALGLARSMTYRGVHPVVQKVERVYEKGVRLCKTVMRPIEARLDRQTGLEKWFITIYPQPTSG